MFRNKKSNVTLYLLYLMSAFLILILTVFIVPFGTKFSTEMHVQGEKLLLDAQDDIQQIQNDTTRRTLESGMHKALDASETNINLQQGIFRYSWIAFLLVLGIILFIGARQIREARIGGGFA